MKKIIAGTILFTALFSAAAFGAEDGITLNIDGVELDCDVAPQITDGRTMVPVRAIFEAVGAEVSYEEETKTVTAVKDDTTVIMVIDSTAEEINGEAVEMDTAPVIIDGRTLAPARYVAEAFGCNVSWNADTKTVDITTPAETAADETAEAATETDEAAETESGDDEYYHGFNLSFFTENSYNLAPIDYSAMSSEDAETHKAVRSLFEQIYLYMELDTNTDMLAGFIENGRFDLFTNSIHAFWEAAMLYQASNDLPEDASADDTEKYLNSLDQDCQLDSDDNFVVLINNIENGPIMLLLEMAEDEYDTSCLYIGAVFDNEGSLRYYVLQKDSEGGLNICQLIGEPSGSDVNVYSSFMTSLEHGDNIKETFLKTIIDDYFS